jgi:hypothetical protein
MPEPEPRHIAFKAIRGVPSPIRRKPEADKKTRLAGVSALIEAGQLFLPREAPWLGEFKHELLAFPSARHDDQVDALSQVLSWVDRQDRFDGPAAGPILFIDGREWSGDDYPSGWADRDDFGYGSYDPDWHGDPLW